MTLFYLYPQPSFILMANYIPFWGTRDGNDSSLASILASSRFNGLNKNCNSTQFIQGFWGRQNLYNSLVRRAWALRRQSSSLCPSPSPCRSFGKLVITPEGYSRRKSKFDCKINGWALGAAFRHGLPSWAVRTSEHKHRA